MVRQNGLSVRIRDGVDGPPMPEHNTESGGNNVALEAVDGATLCPEITVHRDFDWQGANGLYITVDYGYPLLRLILLWAPDPYGGEDTPDRKDLTFKIPGTRSWDPSTDRVTNVEFLFSSEHTWDCGLSYKDCEQLRSQVAASIGKTRVSLQRKKLSNKVESRNIEKNFAWSPTSAHICRHFLDWYPDRNPHLSICERKTDSELAFEGMIIDPQLSFLEARQGPASVGMCSVFVYRRSDDSVKTASPKTRGITPNPSQAPRAVQNSHEISIATEPELSDMGGAAIMSEASHNGNITSQTLQKRVGTEREAQDTWFQQVFKKARHKEQLEGQENEDDDILGRSRSKGSPMQPFSRQSYISTPSKSSAISALESRTLLAIPGPETGSSLQPISPQKSFPTQRAFSAISQDTGLTSLSPNGVIEAKIDVHGGESAAQSAELIDDNVQRTSNTRELTISEASTCLSEQQPQLQHNHQNPVSNEMTLLTNPSSGQGLHRDIEETSSEWEARIKTLKHERARLRQEVEQKLIDEIQALRHQL